MSKRLWTVGAVEVDMEKMNELAGGIQRSILLGVGCVKRSLSADAALQLFTETRLSRWEL